MEVQGDAKPLQNRGFFMRGQIGLHPSSPRCVRLQHRISHRFRKVVVGHLQVMLSSNRFGVADPRAGDVRGEVFFKFRLSSAAEILE
jgi:hypothetical protein